MLSSSQDNILYESAMMRCLYSSDNSTISTNEESDLIVFNQISISTKRAVSYALAQSVKLSSLENSVEKLLKTLNQYTKSLQEKVQFLYPKKRFQLKYIGILFQEKYSINLHSDVLDIPEVFFFFLTTSQYTL